MALPPKGDPRRCLVLAVRSLRLLACIVFFLCTCGGMYLLAALYALANQSRSITLAAFVILYAYSVTLALLSYYVRRCRRWGVIASLCLISASALVVAVGMARFAIYLSHRRVYPEMILLFAALMLVLAALVQLIIHLSLSLWSLRVIAPLEHGFEPILRPKSDVAASD